MVQLLALLLACGPRGGSDAEPAATDTADPGADVTVRLGPGEARAGVVTDEGALFGGISAEGRPGDLKIYNDRVQFVIQGIRDGSYILRQGGMVIDADVVRDADVPGRDLLDEWAVAVGPARVMDPEVVEVRDDGQVSGQAWIHVEGPESPLEYVTGALESDAVVEDQGLWFATDFILDADSWLMRVETTITATARSVDVQPGDVMFGAKEAGQAWTPGLGLDNTVPETYGYIGFASRSGDVVTATMADPASPFVESLGVSLLSDLLAVAPAYHETVRLEQGESVTVSRYYGVAPDLATLTDAWLDLAGTETQQVEGVVETASGPVPGAWVNVLAEGAPFTVAVTDAEGAFSARLPADVSPGVLASGRGRGIFADLPPGAAHYSPYTTAANQQAVLDSLAHGATAPAWAEGYGVASEDAPLELVDPAVVTLVAADGLPFEARFSLSAGGTSAGAGLVFDRPSGYTALAWARDGEVSVPLEPGTYSVVVHRGVRWEADQQTFTVGTGEALSLPVSLEEAVSPAGWLVADPHVHAAPSPDGGISMAERMVVAAGVGVQLHFGTDHDHIVDYTPLVAPLGLDAWVQPVVASEFSPLVRGHVNCYPLASDPTLPNGGALRWWLPEERVETTQEQFDRMAEAMPGALFQLNHPLDGLASLAGWSPGVISRPDNWTEDFDVIEVNNGGSHSEELELYLDLVNRGLLPAPVSVSDSHSHISGGPGLNVTWLYLGVDDPSALTPDALVDAMLARATVATTGPFLALSVLPGTTLTAATDLDVEALSPSWIRVDRLLLVENGEVVETVQGTTATFALDSPQDATYVVVAEGDQAMSPVSGMRPWAMSSAILLDADGDGWEPPLPPLAVGR